LTVCHLDVFLVYRHTLDEIDVGAMRNAQAHLLDVQGRVFRDIQVAVESEILLVVWGEGDTDARVAVYLHRVGEIVSVEVYGTVGYRRCELLTQYPDLIVIYVHLAEYVLRQSSEEVTSLNEVVDAVLFLCLDDCFLVFRILTVVVA